MDEAELHRLYVRHELATAGLVMSDWRRIASEVAAIEREACAKLCEDYAKLCEDYALLSMVDGDPEADHEGAAQHCADLIRLSAS